MIKYREGYDVDYIRLMELLEEAGREVEAKNFKKLVGMVEDADIVVTAWDFDYMVGFAQLSRCEGNDRIQNVLVDSEYRGKGIGKDLVNYILLQNRQGGVQAENETEYVSYFNL